MLIDSMRKIQLSIRFKKLQRLNINLLFNCFNKLIKRYQKSDIKESFRNIQEFSYLQKRIESVDRLNTILNNHFAKKAINQFKSHTEYCNKYLKGLKLLKKTHTQI